ncbi:sulfotransferase [Actinomadura sp. WMMA1423]|uniref:sulfotransferase n=1 Tax=Actinomadura sp. WMMA1423 TaxID=2591108 RepID=UPI00143DBE6D|nr:sulfotransferase [Actinomadura sp. WMMA1423]
MDDSDTVPVVFVAGNSRSGSTLVSRVLGAVPGFCAVGELFFLWDHGVLRNDMCGCGARFHDCPFWLAVGKEAFGGWDRVDAAEVLRLRASVARMHYLPFLAAPRAAPRFRRRLDRYAEIMGALFRGVRAASGCTFVIDSSKWPAAAQTVRHAPGTSMRMLHLVRASHGVCFSCTKRIARPDLGGVPMPRQSPARTAVQWTVFNLTLDLFGVLGMPTMTLRYEDFVAQPRAHLERVLSFLGSEVPGDLPFLGADAVELGRDHLVAANPMRIRAGREPLRLDEDWRSALPAGSKRLVSALTAPGLLRYGYPVFPG